MASNYGKIRVTVADPDAIHYATFQSFNQKVVWNRRGIFTAHLRTRDKPYKAQTWRLSHSADGGRTFSALFEDTHATNAPVIETDAEDNIYLFRVDLNTYADGFLYRFLAARDYREPVITPVPSGSGDKYSMLLDPERRLLYCFVNHRKFHALDFEGRVVRSFPNFLQPGANAGMEYPALSLDRNGALHAAWTNNKKGVYLYWDIHHACSPDGGATWRNLDGAPLTPPITDDNTGPSLRITADDEFDIHTWLASVMAKNGKLHFVYQALATPPRMQYWRYDVATGKPDVHLTPDFRGREYRLNGFDGFFASARLEPESPLYCVMADDGHLVCLASRDNGASWSDHARSAEQFSRPYSITGCRELSPDGAILGMFTDHEPAEASITSFSKGIVRFFRIDPESR